VAVKVLRQCTHVLPINAYWNEVRDREVEYFEEGNGGIRMSSVFIVQC
jgi:hypothetical protein